MDRNSFIHKIEEQWSSARIVALLGPRQSGKTTLARQYARQSPWKFDPGLQYFDLEDPAHLARLDNPMLALGSLEGLVIIDEVQNRPELFPVLRVLVDRENNPARFLILGSASRDLIRQGAETLAGRIGFVEVTPFHADEVGSTFQDRLWLRGGYPRSFLAETDHSSWLWREAYIKTFLERDVPSLGIQIPAATLRRFWMMLAHVHGQVFNASEIGKSMGIAHTTAARYLDLLSGTFMVRRLMPWYENIKKRQVKSPKFFFRDAGILHRLLGLPDMAALMVHPRMGASWEGFALEQVISLSGADADDVYFWGVHGQGELDLLIHHRGKRLGFEIKYSDHPRVTASHRLALDALSLDRLTIVCPGNSSYPLDEKIGVRGLLDVMDHPETLWTGW
jgi:predicted AAA+ superfamily ATPase